MTGIARRMLLIANIQIAQRDIFTNPPPIFIELVSFLVHLIKWVFENWRAPDVPLKTVPDKTREFWQNNPLEKGKIHRGKNSLCTAIDRDWDTGSRDLPQNSLKRKTVSWNICLSTWAWIRKCSRMFCQKNSKTIMNISVVMTLILLWSVNF